MLLMNCRVPKRSTTVPTTWRKEGQGGREGHGEERKNKGCKGGEDGGEGDREGEVKNK